MEKNLKDLEKQSLGELEGIIQNHFCTFFYEVGCALAQIRDSELYKETYTTFEDYCKERWGMSRQRAYQLIKAAEVYDNLSTAVDKPINEAQIRPLTKLSSPDKQLEAYTRAVETAPEGLMTATHVSKVVEEMTTKPKKQRTERQDNRDLLPNAVELANETTGQLGLINDDEFENNHNISSNAMDLADAAIGQLELIRDDDPRKEEALSHVEKWISSRRQRDENMPPCVPTQLFN